MFDELTPRDKAVLIGLYLSRFDRKALDGLGFTTFRQAYNVLGYSIDVMPKSIQNYRDEFDPYFPNKRKGWRNRNMRDFCKFFYEKTQEFDFDAFCAIIKSFISDDYIDLKDIDLGGGNTFKNKTEAKSFADRLITGKAAEEYFKMNYSTIDVFGNYTLTDTTNMGCGFDFKLSYGERRFYVEVKGINAHSGSILMTEKEYDIAKCLRKLYCLFVVSNFRNTPEHHMYFDPLSETNLRFNRQERQITQTSYTVKINDI